MRDVLTGLDPEIAVRTVGPEFLAIRWYPSTDIIAWHHAVFEGPARSDERAFAEAVQRGLDISTGLVRRTLMRFLTPETLADKAAELWTTFHTHGELVVESKSEGAARIAIRNHPFLDDALSRRVIAMMSRHMLARSRAKNVREAHELRAPQELVVQVTWTM
jgi:hypothetical protein